MKTLALEFSSDVRSVAVADPDRVLACVSERGGRATRAFALIESALHQAGLEREAITRIVVGLGPGSYNGIRAALAVAQGWRLARDLELIGVSSVACLATQVAAEGDEGRVGIVVDAQRGDVYLMVCECEAGQWREIEPLSIVPRSEIVRRVQLGHIFAGPDAAPPQANLRLLYPDAATLVRLGRDAGNPVLDSPLEPIYLRPTAFMKAPPPRFSLP